MNNLKFKYFSNPIQNAEFTDIKCQICGTDNLCLEGEYFDSSDDVVSVCLNCLAEGKVKVNIPEFVNNRFKEHLKEYYNTDYIGKQVKDSIELLEKTPPVPWIQYNDWQVCCGDFTRYIGEWDKEKISQNSPDGEKYIISILDSFSKSKIDDVEEFLDDIGIYTIVFVFECIKCSKKIAVCQSY